MRTLRLTETSTLPTRANHDDAGLDLCADEALTIQPGERAVVGCGITIELPEGSFGAVCSRSGLALKHGVAVLNAPGIIDSGYRGEVKVILINHGHAPFEVQVGDRIAQLVVQPYLALAPTVALSVTVTQRGDGGFGSSGV